MAGYFTSYTGLFSRLDSDAPAVTSIEIPLIQRDYAQGRVDDRATEIRARFLDVLHGALVGEERVGLDFVYGEVDDGTLRPLDGQQRLTTLFLLHWYLGYRAEELTERQPWMNFSYATRPSARLFCQRLVAATPPTDVADPSAWIVDQVWYLHVWKHDPTIQAMLVMIEAIHKSFADCDARAAWKQLISTEEPAISFQLLPIDEMGSGEELYIKMNSRGKPLTTFENFKANLERAIVWAGDKAATFDRRIDGPWSDILWSFRGDGDIVDDEFLRYLTFITDVCEWSLGRAPDGPIEKRALQLFGTEGEDAAKSLSFLFHAFDTWVDVDIAEEFRLLFTKRHDPASNEAPALLLFGTDNVNLFDACCQGYDTGRFSFGRTLLLLAVLLDRANHSNKFSRRLRVLRNLIEASESEFRMFRRPALVADVRRVIADGSLDEIKGFNRAQAEDEQAKSVFLADNPNLAPTLFRLEDHHLLRGSLQAFELDASTFERRAAAFEALMATPDSLLDLTGALLAAGEYAKRRNERDLQFGSQLTGEPWRNLLNGSARANVKETARALGLVLDAVAAGTVMSNSLHQVRMDFLRERMRIGGFDWRYYFVRYDSMREGASGIYASVGGEMGYRVCMLNKTQMNGRFRDPYLTALIREAKVGQAVIDGASGPFFIGGYVEDEHWMELRKSRTALRCAENGFVLRPPVHAEYLEKFQGVCTDFDVGERLILAIPQSFLGSRWVDTHDRVEAGVRLLQALVAAGL